MKTALIFFIVSCLFFLLSLYYLDLVLFLRREKKRFDSDKDEKGYIAYLELRQKKARHPQKKNYYLYLICLTWKKTGEHEKALRLAPFLKKDSLLGISETPLK